MSKLFFLLIFLILYALFYPFIIWNFETIQTTISNTNNPSYSNGEIVNIGIGDSISYSVVHTYLFNIDLPVYVAGMCVRRFNQFWQISIFLGIFLAWYLFLKWRNDPIST